jgi:hypothetical protein
MAADFRWLTPEADDRYRQQSANTSCEQMQYDVCTDVIEFTRSVRRRVRATLLNYRFNNRRNLNRVSSSRG